MAYSPRSVSAKERRREIRRRLADFGLARRPHRLWREPAPRPALDQESPLCAALRALGPVFTAFGAYLASRIDLPLAGIPGDLVALPEGGPPSPPEAVREQINRELGRPVEELYLNFEVEPFEAGLLYQAHRASLPDGQPVTVKLAHRDREQAVGSDLAALSLLQDVPGWEGGAAVHLESALAAFQHEVRQEMDLTHESSVLAAAATDATGCELISVPQVYVGQSTAGVLTVQRLPGRPLNEWLGSSKAGGPDHRKLAGRLCAAWLWQALWTRYFPADVRPRAVTVLPDGRLAFTGTYSALPSATKRELWGYLRATCAADPDAACAHLLRVMERGARPAEDELRHRFRQLVPFRESKGGGEGGGELCHLTALHQRLALEHGFRPPFHLARFQAALFLVSAAARRLAPGQDSLREGLEHVRMAAALGQVRDLMSVGQVKGALTNYAPLVRELPGQLDEVLTLLAAGRAGVRMQMQESADRRKEKNASIKVTALLVALAGVALLGFHLAASAGWASKGGAILVAVLGLLLLLRIGYSR